MKRKFMNKKDTLFLSHAFATGTDEARAIIHDSIQQPDALLQYPSLLLPGFYRDPET